MGEPIVSLVVAASRNGVIGRDGDMPWRLSTDLRRFKRLTMGLPMIMGRRTFDSIGRALPGRHTIVVTRDPNYSVRGTERSDSPTDALRAACAWAVREGVNEVCIVGGGQLYAALRDEADLVRLTRVDADIEGDTFFELPDPARWKVISQISVPAGPKDSHATRYGVFTRRGR